MAVDNGKSSSESSPLGLSSLSEKLDLSRFVREKRLDRFDNVLARRTTQFVLVLDRVHKQHNISAVLRSADAFGIDRVIMIGEDFLYSPEVSRGAERWVERNFFKTSTDAIAALRKLQYELVIFEPEKLSGESQPIYMLPFGRNLAFVLGNEHSGPSAELVAEADYRAFIPMYGFVESFNISVAAAISMFCARFVVQGPREITCFSEKERLARRSSWIRREVYRERQLTNDQSSGQD